MGNKQPDLKRVIPSDASFDARKLAGKSVVVTGGASGLGEEMVRAFVAAGAFVTLGDVSEEQGKKLVAELGDARTAFTRCDVTVWADQVALFKTALARSPCRSLDIVVANAGIGTRDELTFDTSGPDDEPVEPELKVLNTNLIGVMYTAKLALHYLPRQPEGEDRDRCLIMTGSFAGYLDHPGSPQYCAAKWGIRGTMRSLRLSCPKQNMRVNIIAPWFVRTAIVSNRAQEHLDSRGVPFALASDAAAAVMHISSDKSINGRSLGIIPREGNPRGYIDLEKDDDGPQDLLPGWQDSWSR